MSRRFSFKITKTEFKADFIHNLMVTMVFYFQILKYLSFDKIINENDTRSKVQHEFPITLTCYGERVKVHLHVNYVYYF